MGSRLLAQSILSGASEIGQRVDRVYVTAQRDLAWVFASMWESETGRRGGGTLYRVDADDLVPDTDLLSLPDLSFECEQATVTAVYDGYVAFDDARCRRILSKYVKQHEVARALRNAD